MKIRGGRGDTDAGIAMMTTIMVMAVLLALGLAGLNVALTNLRDSSTDRLGSAAMGTAEGGVAQAMAYLRSTGVGTLSCSPTCASNPWGNKANPQTVTVSTGRQYKVWIEVVQAFSPPAYKYGIYKIHSTGTAGNGPGLRTLEQTVTVKPFQYPIGIFAHTVSDAGSANVHKESFFSDGCVTKRQLVNFSGTDVYWGIPAAVHSTQYITTSNNGCSASDANNEHLQTVGSGSSAQTQPRYCNADYSQSYADQDAQGGDLTGTTCLGTSGAYPQTSKFTAADLKDYGGVNARGLTNQEYAALRTLAASQNQYYDCTSTSNCTFTAPDPATYPNAVMYFKLNGGTVNIQNDLNAYGHDYCGSRSLIIVVENGDLHINAGADIVGALFVPDGNYQGNGNNQVWGTLFAKTIDKFNGTADFYLDQCWLNNLPGGMMDVVPTTFHEVDR